MTTRIKLAMTLVAVVLIGAVLVPTLGMAAAPSTTAKQALGGYLYFDTNLSEPAGQSCASCHLPSAGFADPDQDIPVSEGVVKGRFGDRNSPTSAYASFSPPFHFDAVAGLWFGGQFWDGRANDLVEQAKGPFLNSLEMNNPDKAAVVNKVKASAYASLFKQVYGKNAFDIVDTAYNNIADAIAAFESSQQLNSFTSKYDAYLAGKAKLTPLEKKGLALFENPKKGNCAACHPSAGAGALFTDYSYDNLGIPKNMLIPAYQANPNRVDFGLGVTVNDAAENGKFKVSSLRNIAATAPYGHNGYFKTLKEIVHFYNTRDVVAWPAPEYPDTVNTTELGDLKLTSAEEDAIVAFLKTLTDGYWKK